MTIHSHRTAASELLKMFDLILKEDGSGTDCLDSLLWNLQNVRAHHWDMLPTHCDSTIREIALDIGVSWQWLSRSFDDERGTADYSSLKAGPPGYSHEELMRWLRTTHQELRSKIAAFSDSDLDHLRLTPDGDAVETWRLIEMQIQHTEAHTREISHLRALLQGSVTWDPQYMDRDAARNLN